MTTMNVNHSIRGVERATKGERNKSLQRMTVITESGARSELLPSDPMMVSLILKERRAKSPAAKARAKMDAAARKRGI